MADYRHVMYTSKNAVEQVYSELYGDVDQVEIERGSRIGGSVGGKIGSFFSMLSSRFPGKSRETKFTASTMTMKC